MLKIVRILGGLGNQMFNYATLLALRELYPDDVVKADCSLYRGYPLHNGLEIDRVFGVNVEQASMCELMRVTWPYCHYRLWQIGSHLLPRRSTMVREKADFSPVDLTRLPQNCYIDGYWQNECYFRNAEPIVRSAFYFTIPLDDRNKLIMSRIWSSEAVSIHVRRGDYLKHQRYTGICDLDYYRRAIELINNKINNPSFFVFSDDEEWCRQSLSEFFGVAPVEYINHNKGVNSYIDMQLMSSCRHNIIANSTFSWWGAWLNDNPAKIVVSPRRWLNMDLKMQPQCNSWILI